MRRALWGALPLAIVLACGSDDSSSAAATAPSDAGGSDSPTDDGGSSANDGSTSSDSASSDSGSSEKCTDLAQEGAPLNTVRLAPPAPPATGGALADGKYVLVATNLYTDADGGSGGGSNEPTIASTLVVTGNTFAAITVIGGSSELRARTSFTLNGNQLTGTFLCLYPVPDSGVPTGSTTQTYSASATELRTYLDFGAAGGVLEYVYTKK